MIQRETAERVIVKCDHCDATFSGDYDETLDYVVEWARIRGWKVRGAMSTARCPGCARKEQQTDGDLDSAPSESGHV